MAKGHPPFWGHPSPTARQYSVGPPTSLLPEKSVRELECEIARCFKRWELISIDS